MVHLLLAVIYLSFISLGLPDALLGAAWPTIYIQFGVPVSWMGIISMIIALGTILSSLQSDRLTRALGTGKVTALSVALTALALCGFATASSYWQLCLWAVPYGLGAGSVDAALNNYVALHYASRHMSWLHCMWGVGATAGPAVMGFVMARGWQWNAGYGAIAFLQALLTAGLVLSLPLWRKKAAGAQAGGQSVQDEPPAQPLTLRQIVAIPGVREVLVMFFGYCALETTAGQWAASYLVLQRGLSAEAAAGCASMFYIGITLGRAVSGFITMRLSDDQMIRLGLGIILGGVGLLALPLGQTAALAGFVLVGLGCAPVYPSVIHSTPAHFGAQRSQAIIGVQMASAYVGTMLMPPLFGLLANHISAGLLPVYLLAILALMALMHARLARLCPVPAPAKG